jgi:hypothetical protein
MTVDRCLRIALCACWLASSGCTALRELPPGQYTAKPERKYARIVTHDRLVYEFDWVRIEGDTLTGYRRRDVEGEVEDYAELKVPLGDIARLSTRQVDWYRTAIVAGVAIGGVVAVGLSVAKKRNDGGSDTSGGGKPPVP